MTVRAKTSTNNGKRLVTQQSVDGAIMSICDIMRRSNCAGALQYVPELTWILFLRILDERETRHKGDILIFFSVLPTVSTLSHRPREVRPRCAAR